MERFTKFKFCNNVYAVFFVALLKVNDYEFE